MIHRLCARALGGLLIAGVAGLSLFGTGASTASAAPYWYHRHFYPAHRTVGVYPYVGAYGPGYATYPYPYSAYYDVYPGYYGGGYVGGYAGVYPGYVGGYWGGGHWRHGYWGGHGHWRR
jgi:hypothetical protein